MKKFLLVAAILLGFLLVGTLHVALSRSLYFDEAVNMYVGKVIASRGGQYETGMLGSPWAYPELIVGTVLQSLTALGFTGFTWTNIAVPAVREVNVLFGALTVLFVYLTVRRLWGDQEAIWSAALFGITGCVMFIAGFATYDMPSLALLAGSVWLSVEATEDGRSAWSGLLLMGVAGIVFGVSFITKYIVVAFLPGLFAIVFIRRWWFGFVLLVAALTIGLTFVIPRFSALQGLLSYRGGHGASYGSTPLVMLYEVAYFVGPLLVLAFMAVGLVKDKWTLALVILIVSLTTPVCHIVFNDPLALFKHAAWTAFFACLIAGVTLARLQRFNTLASVALFATLALFGWYQVRTLEQFYPDLTTVDAWMQQNISGTDCNILVDDVWTVKWSLNTTFDTKEYCVADEWTWNNKTTSSQDLMSSIYAGTYPYIIYEEGGMFSGDTAVFDQEVIDTVQTSGRYELVGKFLSFVTWGNAILPPEFRGNLPAYSDVTILVWKRR